MRVFRRGRLGWVPYLLARRHEYEKYRDLTHDVTMQPRDYSAGQVFSIREDHLGIELLPHIERPTCCGVDSRRRQHLAALA